MTKSPIIFGRINKRILLPFFLSLTQIIHLIFSKYYPENKNDIILQLLSLALGQIIIKFFPCILKISNEEQKKEKEIKKRKHYFILCALFLLNQIVYSGNVLAGRFLLGQEVSYAESNLFMVHDFIILSIEMVFMTIFSRYLLKYKYFKHHIISIILFIILGIICDVIIKNYGSKYNSSSNKMFLIVNAIQIINCLTDALYFCYQKYMMEILYYPYWNIAFIPGIFIFPFGIALLITALVSPDDGKSKLDFVNKFYLYYKNTNGWIVFGKITIVLVIHIILCPLNILVLYYYSPNFILIIFQISTIVYNLIHNTKESLYCIPLFIFQFLVLMIHLEILELNFVGLNKYTKRNIELRGLIDSFAEGRDSTFGTDKIDINKDYLIEGIENNEKTTEMEEQAESMEETPISNGLN